MSRLHLMRPGAGLAAFRKGVAERRAAVAVMFALTMLPILGFVALAFDVGSLVWARSQLDLAADTAALTGVMTGANAFAANANTSFQPAQLAGQKRFYAQAGQMPRVTLTALTVAVTRSGGTVKSTVTYAATYQTMFASLLGVRTLSVSGAASISRTNSPFFDIEFLLDHSGSMAIAASQSDMNRLGTLVRASPWFYSWGQGQNCAFGCHFDANSNDFYGLAKSNGVSLRMNVLTQAVSNVIQAIIQSPSAAQFQVGVRTFDLALNTVYPTSYDLADAELAAQQITVPLTTNGAGADTNIPYALSSITAALPAAGDGSAAAAPLRYLFIVTDGVTDYYNASGARVIAALDPTQCASLKAHGIQILTLYTLYIPLEPNYVPQANSFYQVNVKPFVQNIFPNLQACASSTAFAFQATDGPSINAALQTMLQQALSQAAKFTQ